MRKIYKTSLSVIGIILIFLLIIAVDYAKYLKENDVNNPIVLVESGLSINYLNGNKIEVNSKEITYTISVTNNSNDTLHYYIRVNNIETNKKDITYILTEKNNALNMPKNVFPTEEADLASYIEIAPSATHTFSLLILENKDANLKADIEIGLEEEKEANFATTILINNDIKKNAITKIGEEAAITDEGLIEGNDENGTLYYFRGNVVNNYVIFANLTWRIVKINGDGSVKLILNDYIDDKINYYNSDNTESISKYCVDDTVNEIEESNTYYLGYSRLLTDYSQVNTCLGSKYNSKIGLLTADEAVFAGATKNAQNTSYYLYTPSKDTSWWTITPVSSNSSDITYFEIGSNGQLKYESLGSYYRGIKPVIDLNKKTYVDGNGTINDPYTIRE